MTDERISTTATTTGVDSIVAPSNVTYETESSATAYAFPPHEPTPRDERLSLYGHDPADVLRAMLHSTPER
jgi:hypothetical protein